MDAVPPPPAFKRVPPGAWAMVAWCAGLAFTFLMRVRLPGEVAPSMTPGVLLYRWDGLLNLGLATATALVGAVSLSRRPLGSLAFLLAAAALASIPLSVAEIPMAQYLAVNVALYYIAATRPRRDAVVALAMALAVLAGYVVTRGLIGWTVGTSAEVAVALVTVIAWLIGRSAGQAQEHTRQLTEQAVTGERLRIARELHDMVAHSVGIIALQAGAARRVIATRPERAEAALGEIEKVGRETLSGLRRMLVALRESDGSSGDAQGLADLDRLAATTTGAGVRVEVRRVGECRPLPGEIDVSAYRLIQEAVTNVVRHAGTGSCEVVVEYRDEELSIEVLDEGRGRGRGGGGSGYGLAGMRERVALLNGVLSTGPRPGGGFRVAARLPLPEAG
ncbi:sensor histidine kinase [Spongiactinospora sp. TRM90649]|uniref:sensor histidine kinase n=1 Tax=Spongiactinospora sp. TRM90649 TaxID=3031114 RepID=UPI0023F7FB54|nr:sensor histidine kinase [Spongiactinospora sp. TRM90649]MDF5757676.1 sensor histidine kinase [Spongiactinospora sp. TRM90649]